MANRIQLRRDTADNWDRVNPILEDGEPGLDITHNQIKYGDGATRWRDLNFSGGLPQADGVVTFPGDFLIGTLHVDQPGSEKESVVWAKDDTEYLGLWWGGDQIYPESINYGPVAGIMIGYAEGATDDFTDNAAPNGTAITIAINDTDYPDGHRQTWVFAKDGNLTLPTGGRIGATKGGTMLDGGYGGSTSLTTFYASENYAACVTGFGNGTLDITTYKDGGVDPSRTWSFDNDGTLTLPGGSAIGYTPAVSTNITVNAKTWAFGVDGNLTLPTGGEIHSTAGTGSVAIEANDGNNTRTWTFGADGALILPTVSGNEGAEIDFTKAPNSTLSGSAIIVDQYIDRLRFFEGGGTSRGAYIDLKQAAAGVGTLLNNRVSGFVNAGAFVTMDLLKATVTTTSNRGLSLAATTGTFAIRIAGTYAKTSTTGGARANVTLTTTPEASMFDWDFIDAGDLSTYIITDTTNNRSYRITLQIGYLYNDNMISIERLI